MPKLTIDGNEIEVEAGLSVLQACRTDNPASTSISLPSMVSFGMSRPYSAATAMSTDAFFLAFIMRSSITGRKCLINPCTGQAWPVQGFIRHFRPVIEERIMNAKKNASVDIAVAAE